MVVSEGIAVIDEAAWQAMHDAAQAAVQRAYVPYSNFPVGAAAIVDDGRLISGCNVENASYGLTLCAECSLISALHMSGGGRLVAFVCVDRAGEVVMPCGRCRQLLHEHAAEGMVLDTAAGLRTIEQLLPEAFGSRNLAAGQAGQSE